MFQSLNLRIPILKFIASGTLLFFTANTFAWAESLATTSAAQNSVSPQLPAHLEIPSSLGRIETQPAVIDPQKPLVIHIQDAHAIQDAQLHIQKLIHYFEKKYGVRLVAVEGSRGAWDPLLLKTFPGKISREKVMQDYFSKGEMTGPEMAAVLNEGNSVYHGIEEWPLYEQNYRAYLAAMEQKETLLQKIQQLQTVLDRERQKIYSDEFEALHQQIENFYEHPEKLEEVLVYLSKVQGRATSEQVKKLFAIFDHENNLDSTALEKSVRVLAKTFERKYLPRLSLAQQKEFQQKYQSFNSESLEASDFLSDLIVLGHQNGFKPKLTPEMQFARRRANLLSSLQGGQVFEELETSLMQLENAKASEKELAIAEKYRQLRLLKNLVSLELTKKQWLVQRASLTPREIENDLLAPALEFYQLAEKRDLALHQNLQKLIRDQKAQAAIVITGGFHAAGLEALAKESGYSYTAIIPNINSLSGQENYDKLMRGNVSWAAQMKSSLHETFMNHAVGKLLEVEGGRSRVDGKKWRDEVIRQLAREERLDQAAKYTKVIDSRVFSASAIDVIIDKYKKQTLEKLWHSFEGNRAAPVMPSALAILGKLDPTVQLSVNSADYRSESRGQELEARVRARLSKDPAWRSVIEKISSKNLAILIDTKPSDLTASISKLLQKKAKSPHDLARALRASVQNIAPKKLKSPVPVDTTPVGPEEKVLNYELRDFFRKIKYESLKPSSSASEWTRNLNKIFSKQGFNAAASYLDDTIMISFTENYSSSQLQVGPQELNAALIQLTAPNVSPKTLGAVFAIFERLQREPLKEHDAMVNAVMEWTREIATTNPDVDRAQVEGISLSFLRFIQISREKPENLINGLVENLKKPRVNVRNYFLRHWAYYWAFYLLKLKDPHYREHLEAIDKKNLLNFAKAIDLELFEIVTEMDAVGFLEIEENPSADDAVLMPLGRGTIPKESFVFALNQILIPSGLLIIFQPSLPGSFDPILYAINNSAYGLNRVTLNGSLAWYLEAQAVFGSEFTDIHRHFHFPGMNTVVIDPLYLASYHKRFTETFAPHIKPSAIFGNQESSQIDVTKRFTYHMEEQPEAYQKLDPKSVANLDRLIFDLEKKGFEPLLLNPASKDAFLDVVQADSHLVLGHEVYHLLSSMLDLPYVNHENEELRGFLFEIAFISTLYPSLIYRSLADLTLKAVLWNDTSWDKYGALQILDALFAEEPSLSEQPDDESRFNVLLDQLSRHSLVDLTPEQIISRLQPLFAANHTHELLKIRNAFQSDYPLVQLYEAHKNEPAYLVIPTLPDSFRAESRSAETLDWLSPEQPRVPIRTDLNRNPLTDVLRQNGIDASKFEALIYPGSGTSDDYLLFLLTRVFPNLHEFHFNSTSYSFLESSAAVNFLNAFLKRFPARERSRIELVTYSKPYEEEKFSIKSSGARIWIDKGMGFNASKQLDNSFYKSTLEIEIVRPGDLVLSVPFMRSPEKMPWKNRIATNVSIPGYEKEKNWAVFLVTEEDVADARSEVRRLEPEELSDIMRVIQDYLVEPHDEKLKKKGLTKVGNGGRRAYFYYGKGFVFGAFQPYENANLVYENALISAQAQLMKTINSDGHRKDLPVLDQVYNEGEHSLLIQKLFPGGQPLYEVSSSHIKHWPQADKIKMALSIAQTFQYLDQRRVVHRDLNPHNIWIPESLLKTRNFSLAPPIVFDFSDSILLNETRDGGHGLYEKLYESIWNSRLFTAGYSYVDPDPNSPFPDIYSVDIRKDLFGFGAVLAEIFGIDTFSHLREAFYKAGGEKNLQLEISDKIDNAGSKLPSAVAGLMKELLKINPKRIQKGINWDFIVRELQKEEAKVFSRTVLVTDWSTHQRFIELLKSVEPSSHLINKVFLEDKEVQITDRTNIAGSLPQLKLPFIYRIDSEGQLKISRAEVRVPETAIVAQDVKQGTIVDLTQVEMTDETVRWLAEQLAPLRLSIPGNISFSSPQTLIRRWEMVLRQKINTTLLLAELDSENRIAKVKGFLSFNDHHQYGTQSELLTIVLAAPRQGGGRYLMQTYFHLLQQKGILRAFWTYINAEDVVPFYESTLKTLEKNNVVERFIQQAEKRKFIVDLKSLTAPPMIYSFMPSLENRVESRATPEQLEEFQNIIDEMKSLLEIEQAAGAELESHLEELSQVLVGQLVAEVFTGAEDMSYKYYQSRFLNSKYWEALVHDLSRVIDTAELSEAFAFKIQQKNMTEDVRQELYEAITVLVLEKLKAFEEQTQENFFTLLHEGRGELAEIIFNRRLSKRFKGKIQIHRPESREAWEVKRRQKLQAAIDKLWAQPEKYGMLRALIQRYSNVQGISNVISRLIPAQSEREAAGELFTAAILENNLKENYDVRVLGLGIHIGYREFDALVRITPKPGTAAQAAFEDGLYLIESKEDGDSHLEKLIRQTRDSQGPQQRENANWLKLAGLPVQGIIIAAGGKNSSQDPEQQTGVFKREPTDSPRFQIEGRTIEAMPIYSVVLNSFDIENDPSADDQLAPKPDDIQIEIWVHELMKVAQLFSHILHPEFYTWPLLQEDGGKAAASALRILQKREQIRLERIHARMAATEKEKEAKERRRAAAEWLEIFSPLNLAPEHFIRQVLEWHFSHHKNTPLSKLRQELELQEPQTAWDWLNERYTLTHAPREKIKKSVTSETDRLMREVDGWTASFKSHIPGFSPTESTRVLTDYFRSTSTGKTRPILRVELQNSIKDLGWEKTWERLERQSQTTAAQVTARSEMRRKKASFAISLQPADSALDLIERFMNDHHLTAEQIVSHMKVLEVTHEDQTIELDLTDRETQESLAEHYFIEGSQVILYFDEASFIPRSEFREIIEFLTVVAAGGMALFGFHFLISLPSVTAQSSSRNEMEKIQKYFEQNPGEWDVDKFRTILKAAQQASLEKENEPETFAAAQKAFEAVAATISESNRNMAQAKMEAIAAIPQDHALYALGLAVLMTLKNSRSQTASFKSTAQKYAKVMTSRAETRLVLNDRYGTPRIFNHHLIVHELETGPAKVESETLDQNEERWIASLLKEIQSQAVKIGDTEMVELLQEFPVKDKIYKTSYDSLGNYALMQTEKIIFASELLRDVLNEKLPRHEDVQIFFKEILIHELTHLIDFRAGRVREDLGMDPAQAAFEKKEVNDAEISAIVRTAAYFNGYIYVTPENNFAAIYEYRLERLKRAAYTTRLSYAQPRAMGSFGYQFLEQNFSRAEFDLLTDGLLVTGEKPFAYYLRMTQILTGNTRAAEIQNETTFDWESHNGNETNQFQATEVNAELMRRYRSDFIRFYSSLDSTGFGDLLAKEIIAGVDSAEDEVVFLMDQSNDELAGFYHLVKYKNEPNSSHLRVIYVREEYRPKGTAHVLLKDLSTRFLAGDPKAKFSADIVRNHERSQKGAFYGTVEEFKSRLGLSSRVISVTPRNPLLVYTRNELRILEGKFEDFKLEVGSMNSIDRSEVLSSAQRIFGVKWASVVDITRLTDEILHRVLITPSVEEAVTAPKNLKEILDHPEILQKYFPTAFLESTDAAVDAELIVAMLQDKTQTQETLRSLLKEEFGKIKILTATGGPEKTIRDFVSGQGDEIQQIAYSVRNPVKHEDLKPEGTLMVLAKTETNFDIDSFAGNLTGLKMNQDVIYQMTKLGLTPRQMMTLLRVLPSLLKAKSHELFNLDLKGLQTGLNALAERWAQELESRERIASAA